MKKKETKDMEWIKCLCITLGAFLLTFLLIYTNLFYGWDKLVSDRLYQTGATPDERIFIVAIDDKTLEQYGPINQWSRDIFRQVVEIFNQNPNAAPAVIAFDKNARCKGGRSRYETIILDSRLSQSGRIHIVHRTAKRQLRIQRFLPSGGS